MQSNFCGGIRANLHLSRLSARPTPLCLQVVHLLGAHLCKFMDVFSSEAWCELFLSSVSMNTISIRKMQLAYIILFSMSDKLRQAFSLSKQPLFKRYAWNLNILRKRPIGPKFTPWKDENNAPSASTLYNYVKIHTFTASVLAKWVERSSHVRKVAGSSPGKVIFVRVFKYL